ncbi:hypothetical protein GCM10025787_15060 [Saccharopolyspora rosea]
MTQRARNAVRLGGRVLAVVLVLLAAGCGREFGETGSQQRHGVSTSLADLQTKITLIRHDPCYTREPHTVYRDCAGRYMTQLRNVGLAARGDVSDQPAVAEHVNPLATTIVNTTADFTAQRCDAQTSDPNRCAADLRTINTSLDDLATTLGRLPAPATTSHP